MRAAASSSEYSGENCARTILFTAKKIMRHIVVTVAMISIMAVNGSRRCGNKQVCGPSQCGPLERPVHGSPRRDRFCRPLFTPPWELSKLRRCVCKQRYLRNSWGECVPRLKCIPCKFKWQRDYRTCAPGCPATCNKRFRTSCNEPCTDGCVCPPGWVVHPRYPRRCIKAYKCLPRCPPNSSYQACVSTCLPKCGQKPPKKCHVNCERGACICKKGYLQLERNGKTTCVLQAVCSWNTRTTRLFKPNVTEYTGTGAGSRTSRTFSDEPESVLREPQYTSHGSPNVALRRNVTSTRLEGTSSSVNAGHTTSYSNEGTEYTLSGGGRTRGSNTSVTHSIGAGRNIDDVSLANTGSTGTSGSSGVGGATSGVPINDTLRPGSVSTGSSVIESSGSDTRVGSSRNTGVAGTRGSSRVAETTNRAPSNSFLHPFLVNTEMSVTESETLGARPPVNANSLFTSGSEGSSTSINHLQGFMRRPENAGQPASTAFTNVTPPDRGTSSGGYAGHNMINLRDGTHSEILGASRIGERGGALDGTRVRHPTDAEINTSVGTPRHDGVVGISGSSGAGEATVRVPTNGRIHTNAAQVGGAAVESGTVSMRTAGSAGLIPSADVNSNSALSSVRATLPGTTAGIAAPGSTPPGAVVPNQTNFGSSTHNSGLHLSSERTLLTDSGVTRAAGLLGRTMTPRGSIATGGRYDAERPVTSSTAIVGIDPAATGSIHNIGSPSSGPISGSPAILPHVSVNHNRVRTGVPGANVNSYTATGIGSSVTDPRNTHSRISAAIPRINETRINGAVLSGNTPLNDFTASGGESSLGTNASPMLVTGGTSTVIPSTRVSATVPRSHGTGMRGEGSPAISNANVLPPLNTEAALASMLSAALGIHEESEAPGGVVPVRTNSNREHISAGATNAESSVSAGISAPGSTRAVPITGGLTEVGVSTRGGAAVTNTGAIPTTGTASPLSIRTESTRGATTGATRSTPGSIRLTSILNATPTVHSDTDGLENMLASISGLSTSAATRLSADTSTRGATHLYPVIPSDTLPVGAADILSALTASGTDRRTGILLGPHGTRSDIPTQPSSDGAETRVLSPPISL
uniref:Putative tritil protein n=1 Tax=Rhipicephalus pulchellus TaxID=72859 RepID=L7LQV7_RHIPC